MPGDKLYELAVSMLEETNPYSVSLDRFKYHSTNQKLISLNYLLKDNIPASSVRNESENRYKAARAISDSLYEYYASYPAPYSYKQKILRDFTAWMNSICDRYSLDIEGVGWMENQPVPSDTAAVTLLKELQAREGVTKDHLARTLHMGKRAVLKNLCRLDPKKNTNIHEYPPLFLGGQLVQNKISVFQNEKNISNRYYTENSVHPIILQENLMQVIVLLQALSQHSFKMNMNTDYTIALDIWYQLTDYAKNKIKQYFENADDSDTVEFIETLESETPIEGFRGFITEREMMTKGDPTGADLLMYVEKQERRIAKIILKSDSVPDETYENVIIGPIDCGKFGIYQGDDQIRVFQKEDVYLLEL